MTVTRSTDPEPPRGGCPAEVWEALTTLLGPGWPEARSDGDGPEYRRSRIGDVILAARAVQSWAESVETDATGELLRDVERELEVRPRASARTSTQARRGEARRVVACELQLLTGRSLTQCRDRVRLASASPHRAGYLRSRMALGTLDAYRATTVLKEAGHLDPVTADRIARYALRPVGAAPTDPEDAQTWAAERAALADRVPVSQATFRDRLRSAITRVEGAAHSARRAAREAEAAREVRSEAGDHGMGITWITATRDRIFTAQHRIDTLARRARQSGDPRTLTQLRSDIATDLLLHGTVPNHQSLSAPAPVRMNVFVSLASILPGAPADQGVGEVPGYGYLTADQTRQLALAQGSTWRRLVTDPTSGIVIDAASCYRPSRAMRAAVVARDRRCRAPGCEHPATEADLDHDTNWRTGASDPREGATHPDNLHALHRGHHELKTAGWWHSTQERNGVVRWSTLTGRRLTTVPPGVPGADQTRDALSTVEQDLAGLAERSLDPPALQSGTAALHHVVGGSDPPPF